MPPSTTDISWFMPCSLWNRLSSEFSLKLCVTYSHFTIHLYLYLYVYVWMYSLHNILGVSLLVAVSFASAFFLCSFASLWPITLSRTIRGLNWSTISNLLFRAVIFSMGVLLIRGRPLVPSPFSKPLSDLFK